MRSTWRLMAAAAFALLICVPATYAQTPEASVLPVTEPLDVGGTILQPGQYLIRVVPIKTDRNRVQITSLDKMTLYATVLTVPHQLEPGEEVPNTTFVYFPAGEGMPAALRTWFAPHPEASQGGHDIVYEESRARQLARLAREGVPSFREDTEIAEFETTEVTIIEPEVTTITTPAPIVEAPAPVIETPVTVPEPMISAETPEMPTTASRLPLIALLGIASLAAALVIRIARA